MAERIFWRRKERKADDIAWHEGWIIGEQFINDHEKKLIEIGCSRITSIGTWFDVADLELLEADHD